MSLYRSIIKQSFVVAWKHKYLWVLGLFATFLASNFEISLINRFLNRQASTIYDWQAWIQSGIFSPKAWGSFLQLAQTDPGSFIGLLVVFIIVVALALFLLWLAVVSQAGLVSNTNKALVEGGRVGSKAEQKHDMALAFREGRKKFWPVLGLNIVVRLLASVLALITIAPIFVTPQVSVALSIVYFIIFILLLAIALILTFIMKYAVAYIVLKNQGFAQSMTSAWRLFRKNWLVSLEMTFILFALSLVVSLALIIAVMVMAIPIALLYIFSFFIGSFIAFVAILVLGILISIGIIVIGGSVLTVVQTIAWVQLFDQLNAGKGPESKLERGFRRIM
jgi:hypothetical protein